MNQSVSSALRGLVFLAAGAFLAPGSLFAVDHEVRILLDLDNDAATGCTVPTVEGPFDGVEQILITTVETTSPPPAGTVTDVAISDCINPATDTFGPPASFDGGWPIGIDNGEGGLDVVETYFPLLSSVVPDPKIIRLAVVVTDELGGVQALLTEDGTPDGPAILIDLRSLLEIPTLGEWGLILLALLLAGSSIALLGRRGAVAAAAALLLLGGGLAWAAPGLDGLIDDWFAQDRVAGNGIVLWAKQVGNDLCFRVDVELLFNTSPTADPQSVTTDEDTPVAITLTGSDPESDPLTFTIVPGSGPDNGTLTGTPPNVTYTPDPDYNGPDSFDFQVEDPSGATGTATVSITVDPVNDAPVVDAATFSVAEDAPVGTSVGTATFTDPDAGQSHTFAITAGNTGGAFAINATTGEITTAAALDFETLASYSLTVEVTDDGAPVLSGSNTVTVNVTDVDDAPVAVDDAATVTEDDPATAIDVLANDTDQDGGPISIQSVTQPANGTVVITNAGADLTYEPDADYCNDGSPTDDFTYTLNGGSTATVAVTVTCEDDDPVAVDDAPTVAEDSGANAIDVLANDTDVDGGPISIQSVTQPTNGTVVITNAGADLTYEPDADYCNDGSPLDTFTYTLTPGGSTATVSVTVTCVDDPPTAVADAATVAEDSGANTIDVLANDTDIDGGPISVQSVTQPANGTVAITNGGADVSYTPDANYCNDASPTDDFTYTLNGGSTATVAVTVTCVDDPPLAVNDSATVTEDSGANTIDVLANDTDIDGGPKLIESVTQPANGAVVITNAGADLTYAPDADYCNDGSPLDTFTYTLNGGSTATVSVTVTCVNDAPVLDLDADDDKGTGGADFAVAYTEGDGAELLEDPDDPLGATITDIDSTTLVSLTVTLTNLLDAGEELLDADVSAFAPDITKDYDTTTTPGVGVLTISSVTPQPIADYVAILRTVSYEHTGDDPDTSAARLVEFVANDGTSDSNTAVSTVTITAVDDAPVAVDDAATVNEDSGANAIDVLANDTDVDGGTIEVQSVTQPANGSVVITGGGTGLTYAPNANYCNDGSPLDTFTYTLNGGSTATVSVTVTCVDDDPTAVDDAATVVEDSGANAIDVLANDTDPDGGLIEVQSVTQPTNGTVVITGGGTGLTYAPNLNYCNDGSPLDTFTYTLNGGSTATVSVTVTCVDDDPVAVADAATVVEDSGANAIDVLANDTDVDGGLKEVQSVTQPSGGSVAITGGGTGVSYTPNLNFCNDGTPTDDFTYTLNGGSSTTVSVTVTCVDDPPVAVADAATVIEDSGANAIDVLANDTDIDGGLKEVQSVTQPSGGTVAITGGGTGVSYTPNLNFCNDGTPTDDFTYTLNGGSSTTVSVTVTCVNDPPVAGADAFDFIGNTELRVDTGTTATPHALETTGSGFGVLDNDADPVEGDNIAVTSITVGACTDSTGPTFTCSDPAVGTVHMNPDGSFSFEPAAGDAGASESFTYVVTDDGAPSPASATGTVTLTRSERVWYVDNDTPTAGVAGTSVDPFDTLAEAQTASLANDYIFVHFGDGTSTGQNAGIALKTGQRLLGEHVGLSIPVNLNGNGSPTVLKAAVPGNRSVIGDAAAGSPEGVSAIDAIPAEVAGLSLSGNVNAIEWTTTAPFAGTGTFSIHDNVVTGAGANGVDVNLAGTGATRLAFHDNNLTATGTALNVQETGAGALTITAFDDNVVSGNTGGSGIVINNAIFDAVPGGGFDLVAGGTTVVGASANGVGGSGVVMTNVTGDLLFTDLDVFAENGTGLQVSSTGAANLAGGTGMRFRVGAGVGIIEATGGPAVNLSNLTADLQLTTVKSTSTTTKGVSLATVSDGGGTNAVFTAGSGSSITTTAGATGPVFDVSGGDAKITYAGTITNTGTGRAVSIASWAGDDAGDDLLFSGAIDENGAGILLNANGGSRSITFSGGLDIDTGANEGFAATSNTNTGGLHITGTNTIDTTTATALRVTNSGIGSSGLTFRSISAGTGVGSGGNGIVLDGTGTAGGNGGLTVTGTGTTGSGGTIQHKTGADGSTTAGIGIFLKDTKSPSFSWMQLNDFDNSAITGRNVQGFTLQNSVINGTIGTTNVGPEGPINFGVSNPGGTNGLQGTGLIRNTKISGGVEHNLEFYNQSGSMNLTIDGTSAVSEGANPNSPADDTADCIIEENSVGLGGDGIQIEMQNTATATVVIDRCLFRDNKSQAVQVSALNSTSVTVTIDESVARKFDQGNEGFILQNGADADLTALVSNNRINNFGGTAIFVGQVAGNASSASELHATILNNTITQPTTATNHGIIAFLTSTVGQVSQARLRIEGNNVTNNSTIGTTRGILVDTPDGSTTPAFHATASGNTVSVGDNVNGVAGLVVQSRQGSDACANIHTNTVTFPNGTPAGIFGLRARQANTATFDLEQGPGCAGTPAAVLACRNPASTTEVLGTLTVVSAGTCLLPNTP